MLRPIQNDYGEKPEYLDFAGQIRALASWGIRFDGRYNEEEAKRYLQNNNSFFRLVSYCDSFEHHSTADGQRRYEQVDFEQLVDLSVIDFRLREVLLLLTIHIEHHLKIKLSGILRQRGFDPLDTVYEFESQGGLNYSLRTILERAGRSDYARDIYAEYEPEVPVWVVLELLQLGELQVFVNFLRYRLREGSLEREELDHLFYELGSARSLRNAAAHNTGILNGLLRQDERALSDRIYNVLIEAEDADGHYLFEEQELDDSRMARALKDITTTLYLHHHLVTSRGVSESIAERLAELEARFTKRIPWSLTTTVGQSLDYISRVIKLWFLLDEGGSHDGV